MSVRKLKNEKYRADVRDASGKRHRKVFRTKKAADKWERDMIDQAEQGIAPQHGNGTLRAFVEEWERSTSHSLRANTTSGYSKVVQSRILPAFGDVPLRKIDHRLVQAWVDELATSGKNGEPLSPRTVEYYFSVLSVIMKRAAGYGLCKPIQRAGRRHYQGVLLPAKVKTRRHTPTPAEINLLADMIDAPYRALVLTAGFCGLRQSELFGLHPDAVDFDAHKLYVRRTVEHSTGSVVDLTKNGKDRRVTMPDVVEAALEHQLREHPHPGFVFHRNGGHLTASTFHHEVWEPARERAELDHVWFHSLRHAAASIMIGKAGWNAKRVQIELGHHSPAFTLDQYADLFVEDDAPARAGMNAALSAALAAAKSAPGETRTPTPSRTADFEPAASTDSATGAGEEATR